MKGYRWFITITLLFSVIALFIEQTFSTFKYFIIIEQVIQYILIFGVIVETLYELFSTTYKQKYFKENIFQLLILLFFLAIFFSFTISKNFLYATDVAIVLILVKDFFIFLQNHTKIQRIAKYVERLSSNPAQTIVLSFVIIILIGTFLLMMSFTSVSGKGLNLINALFTSTSAVCVTGLAVVDTITSFNFFGQIVLILLIQIGGLGIMILSFFTIYVVKRRVSLENKLLLSYMLSDDDTTSIYKSLTGIVVITLIIELVGAIFLFIGFIPEFGFTLKTLWYSIFHSVSAFCNAGFALFSNSLEGFRNNTYIMIIISVLIILGGIGFSCIANVHQIIKERLKYFKAKFTRKKQIPVLKESLTINNKIVLLITAGLLLSGTLLFYILEFDNTMKDYSLWEQYLSAFFQSVTFRTAGFNSVPFDNLRPATYLLFCVFMFIGAASGSTAGGIKVNTIAVIFASIKSYLKGDKHIRLGNYEIQNDKVMRSFLIFTSGIICVMTATILLSLSEKPTIIRVLFEVVSAIGTVGVSSGITSSLSFFGKIIIILLMFWGRIGALTILASANRDTNKSKIRWPQADISIG